MNRILIRIMTAYQVWQTKSETDRRLINIYIYRLHTCLKLYPYFVDTFCSREMILLFLETLCTSYGPTGHYNVMTIVIPHQYLYQFYQYRESLRVPNGVRSSSFRSERRLTYAIARSTIACNEFRRTAASLPLPSVPSSSE